MSKNENDVLKNELMQLDQKLANITTTLDSQQKGFEENFSVCTSSIEAMSIIRYYAARNDEMTVSDLEDGVISCLQRLEEIRRSTTQPELQKYTEERQQFIFGALLDLAKRKKIPSGELLSVLRQNLDIDGIKATVNLDDVCRVYGTEEERNWWLLLLA
jgi:hypothetical protein